MTEEVSRWMEIAAAKVGRSGHGFSAKFTAVEALALHDMGYIGLERHYLEFLREFKSIGRPGFFDRPNNVDFTMRKGTVFNTLVSARIGVHDQRNRRRA